MLPDLVVPQTLRAYVQTVTAEATPFTIVRSDVANKCAVPVRPGLVRANLPRTRRTEITLLLRTHRTPRIHERHHQLSKLTAPERQRDDKFVAPVFAGAASNDRAAMRLDRIADDGQSDANRHCGSPPLREPRCSKNKSCPSSRVNLFNAAPSGE